MMELYFSSETWFIISSILTPIGYVIQDVVADAMTVEAVENKNTKFNYKNKISKRDEHMLLQLLWKIFNYFGFTSSWSSKCLYFFRY